VREALGREDFFVSPANAEAVAMIEGWLDWPSNKLVLTGPPGAGKTHLVHVWAKLSGARMVRAGDLADADIPELAKTHIAVEDCDTIAGNRAAEEALFHLHNLALAEGRSILFTATKPANLWHLSLPDLASRMQGTPASPLHEPDDTLLGVVMLKLLADRQVTPTPNTVPYLVRRIDRSFAAARDVVERLDSMALSSSRPINRTLAAKLLDN